MKFLVYTFLFFAALIGCAFSAMENKGSAQPETIKPSENIVTKTMSVDSFDKLEISSGIFVNFIQTDSADTTRRVQIKGPDNIVDKVIVQTEKGKLTVSLPKGLTIDKGDSLARMARMARIDSILRVDSLRNDSILAVKAQKLAEKDSLKTLKIMEKMEKDSLKAVMKAEKDSLKLLEAAADTVVKDKKKGKEKVAKGDIAAQNIAKAKEKAAAKEAAKAEKDKKAKAGKVDSAKVNAKNDSLKAKPKKVKAPKAKKDSASNDSSKFLSRKVKGFAKNDSSIHISEWADSVLKNDSIQQKNKFNRQDSTESVVVVTIIAPAPEKIIMTGSAKFCSMSLKVEGLIVTLKDSSVFDVDTLIAVWNRIEIDSAAMDSMMSDSAHVKGKKVKKGKKSKKNEDVDSISDDSKKSKSKKSKKDDSSDEPKAEKSKSKKAKKGEAVDSLTVANDSTSADGKAGKVKGKKSKKVESNESSSGGDEKASKSKKSKKSEANDSIDSKAKEAAKAEKEAAKAEEKAKKDSLALVKSRADFVGHVRFDAYDASIIKVDSIYSEYVVLDMTDESEAEIGGETGVLNFNIIHMSRANLLNLHALRGNVTDAALSMVEVQIDTVSTRSVSGVSLYDNIMDPKTQVAKVKSKTLEFKAYLIDAKYQIRLALAKAEEAREIAEIAKARSKVNKAKARVEEDNARETKLAETLSASEYNKHKYMKSGGQTAKDQQQAARSYNTPKNPQEAKALATQ
ncbi:MAG: hypothetical protein K2H32_05685, partial [Muribaculaceae bacterium]|nr:hypothetical protein [Muribaculaceae bacterium]